MLKLDHKLNPASEHDHAVADPEHDDTMQVSFEEGGDPDYDAGADPEYDAIMQANYELGVGAATRSPPSLNSQRHRYPRLLHPLPVLLLLSPWATRSYQLPSSRHTPWSGAGCSGTATRPQDWCSVCPLANGAFPGGRLGQDPSCSQGN